MSKIRILHVTFDMAIGGTEQVIRQLVLNLPASEFENEIFCIDGKIGAVGDMLQQQGIQIHASPRQAGLDFQLIKTLRKILRSGRFDVVHCHQYTPWVYGWFAAWGTKTKVVFTEHGRFYPDRYRVKAWPLNVIMGLTSAAIIAISEATRIALFRYEAIFSWLTSVVYNGITELSVSEQARNDIRQLFNINEGSLLIGTIARLNKVKNIELMIKATHQLLAKKIDVRLLLVGDGPERQSLENLVKELDISEFVIFTGFISKPADYIAALDVFLLTSFTEGTSMTLLEAMSLGVPCIVTKVGGNPEVVIAEQTGKVINSNDLNALTNAVLSIVENPVQTIQMVEKGKVKFFQDFTVKAMCRKYRNIYFKICRSTMETQ